MLPDDELQSFYSRLRTEALPPAELESRIAVAVSRRRPNRLLYAAAAVLLFLAGFAFHAWRTQTPEFTHVLFLSNGPTYVRGTGRVDEYRAWARDLRARNVVIDGVKLKSASSPLSGYFMIRARDLDEAKRIAATCPHIRHGGTIEVREIDGV